MTDGDEWMEPGSVVYPAIYQQVCKPSGHILSGGRCIDCGARFATETSPPEPPDAQP